MTTLTAPHIDRTEEGATMTTLSPARIMEVGMAFWPAKVLLSAIELQLFTTLGSGSMTGTDLQAALGLHARANPDFFDTLVAMHFLDRDGDGATARYRNTPETGAFLDRNSPQFMRDRHLEGSAARRRHGKRQPEHASDDPLDLTENPDANARLSAHWPGGWTGGRSASD